MKYPSPSWGRLPGMRWLLFALLASASATTVRTPNNPNSLNSTQPRLRKAAFVEGHGSAVAVAAQAQAPAAPPPTTGPSAHDVWRLFRQLLGYGVLACGAAFWAYWVPVKLHSEHEKFLAEKLEGRTFNMYLAYRFNFWMDSEGLAVTCPGKHLQFCLFLLSMKKR